MKLFRKIFSPKIVVFISILTLTGIVLESCGPKAACGGKSAHKSRAKKMKKMAPSMAG